MKKWKHRCLFLVFYSSQQRERRDSSGKACLSGYVDLFNNICLTEVERRSMDEQSQRGEKYAKFFKFQTWGLNACRAPWVWRQIDSYDFVCVTDAERWAADQQTQRAANNTAADGRCKAGFVFRSAFNGDQVCVTAEEREAALQQNFGSGFKILYRRFFNGVDELQQPRQQQNSKL